MQRKAREGFRKAPEDGRVDIAGIKEELEIVKRQAIVYSLYARKEKSVMVRFIQECASLCVCVCFCNCVPLFVCVCVCREGGKGAF